MKNILHMDTVGRFNRLLGQKTYHPLVNVIDLSGVEHTCDDVLKAGFYSVWLKEYPCEQFVFGRKAYDYSDGTVFFLAPGDSFEMEDACRVSGSKGWLLVFHPELIRCTCRDLLIDEYTFFRYNKEEALHISLREKKIFMQCLENIRDELHRPVDKHSRILLIRSLGLLLGYCRRFYDRQFITRGENNKQLLRRSRRILDDYFLHNRTGRAPTARYCAGLLHVSIPYFTDLLHIETGHTFDEYMETMRMDIAKRWLLGTNKSIGQIADALGYSSPGYFSRLFIRLMGCRPDDYRPAGNL